MMLPYIKNGSGARSLTSEIGGLWLTEDCPSATLKGGTGLSSHGSPGITQRVPPALVGEYGSPQAMMGGDGLTVVAGGRVYYCGEDLGEVTEGKKAMAVVGRRIYIFPDKKYIDTVSRIMGDMEASVVLEGASFENGAIIAEVSAWPFEVGDGVTIEGCESLSANNMSLIVRGTEEGRLVFDDNVFDSGSESGRVTVSRRVPDLEVVCESGNRLWGCSGNVIYGSKLGDPLNFFVYDGLSTDSYAVAVSGSGDFTACSPYSSHIIFFKEDMAWKLYGTRPSNFQLMQAKIPGVRRGCAGTLVTDSEDMYYLGNDGVFVYSGGVPENISYMLGDIPGKDACGAVHDGRYYISHDGGTLTYDIMRRTWLPWGREEAASFAKEGGRMMMLCRDGRLLALDEGEEAEDWSMEFNVFKDGTGRSSRCTSIVIDAQPDKGAWFSLFIREGQQWRRAATFDWQCRGLRPIRLPPNRGSRLSIKLEGHGRCIIRSIERRLRIGSDIG